MVGLFSAPGIALLWIEPLTFPVALLCFAHAFAVPALQARRGARAVVAMGSEQSAATTGAATAPERVALGLLGDLVGRGGIDIVNESGLAPYRGDLGVWLVGEQGAFLVRRGAFGSRRVFCWCVRIGDANGLPAADRVAHLFLALREDEQGFATVANLNFSGAAWRLGRHLPAAQRAALSI